MRLAIILTIIITTVLAASIGWAASLSVDSDHLTAIQIDQAPEVPTPSPTPVPVPMTLYLDGTPNPDQLLDHQPTTTSTVNLGLLLGNHYSMALPGTVGSASNTSDWQLTLVVSTPLLVSLNVNVDLAVYWQDGGASCTTPVAGQIFAQGIVLLTAPVAANRRGTLLNIPATAGTVNHLFDANDLLCLRMSTLLSLGGSYQTGLISLTGITGVMTNLQGPVYAP